MLSLLVLASACTQELMEPRTDQTGDEKVTVDFSVMIPDARPVTRAMGESPQLSNLYLAVFDEAGYLVEYVKADPVELAAANGTSYVYSAELTISQTPRIIHWIGNAPESVEYGSEEAVLMAMKSKGDQDMYWYRKTVPEIAGMELDDMVVPAETTVQALSDIPLIRNFVKIILNDNAEAFQLESWTVVNVLDSGLAAAYDFGNGTFVEYLAEDGTPKSYAELVEAGYNASTPAISNYVNYSAAWDKRVNAGSACYVYEREKPIETPAYIIAYGEFEGEDVYYKIDLRDEAGNYFPLFRNFQYTVNLNAVNRTGYRSLAEAANSGGSGDVSTSLETESLIYMSDGNASLEVGYTAIVTTSEDPVSLPFAFYPNLMALYDGPNGMVAQNFNASVAFFINDDAGISGAAVSAIEEPDYNYMPYPRVNIVPAKPEDTPKTQSITVQATYTDPDGIVRTLQRKVRYTVMNKQLLTAECKPAEVPQESGSAFELELSIPGGLSVGMFPLDFMIEAEKLSITPDSSLDHMPVETGKSITGSGKASFCFVKTLTWAEYGALENVDGRKTFSAYFKTNKDVSATEIYVANEYFYGMHDGNELSYAVADLDNFVPQHFTGLAYSADPIPVGRDQHVTFSFNMSAMPEDGKVVLTMTGIAPGDDETKLTRLGIVDGNKVQYLYEPSSYTGTHSFDLVTTNTDADPVVALSAYHFVDASKSAGRNRSAFNGSFSKGSLGVDAVETVWYDFSLPVYTADMEVTVTLDGLTPADSKLTLVSGNTYIYKPASGGSQSLLLSSVDTQEKTCSITLAAEGYHTEQDTIDQIGEIVIPAGNLRMRRIVNGRTEVDLRDDGYAPKVFNADPGTDPDAVALMTLEDIDRTGNGNNRIYYNASDIVLKGVSVDQTIYLRVSFRSNTTTNYYVASVKVSDLVASQQTLTFSRVQ